MIFGIGLGKTGTHSLCEAMGILGYKSKHHPSRKDLKYKLDDYDFLNDHVIAWQYKFLDHNYPGSKFILCTRELESWVKSYRDSAIPNSGSFFTRQSRFMLYGASQFDETLWRKAHPKYYAEVFKHFANRKEDLLVMNIRAGDGWEKLCKWLGKDVLDIPFPWYKSINRWASK